MFLQSTSAYLKPLTVFGSWAIKTSSPQFGNLSSQPLASRLSLPTRRSFSTPTNTIPDTLKMRNIGISAHIDSGKTTLTERILFYCGRIKDIHEVKGKDGVGAKMDSMELEREKGITIQSAATHINWGETHINIIDTPGHVDFTIEVERALRVLDGAILVLCGVGGVQSQTMTVDRQMRRYKVPRIGFINKLDRMGADPFRVTDAVKDRLKLNCGMIQIPIGLDYSHEGVVDLITQKAYYFDGYKGTEMIEKEIPENLKEMTQKYRQILIEQIASTDNTLGEIVIMEEREPTVEELKAAIRRTTIAQTFVPMMMGSAYQNKGVQLLLNAVVDYLPNPAEVTYHALDQNNEEAEVDLFADPKKPFVGLAFKLEESKYGQLTYVRIYQGTIKRGEYITNIKNGKKLRVQRLVRMHSNEMEEVNSVASGDICVIFGVDCSSGDTFTDGTVSYTMESMYVPKPVITLAIEVAREHEANFGKALNKFQKEDPTFTVIRDPETNQILVRGMGELHLEVYVERMRREFGVDCSTGRPEVAFRETIRSSSTFDFLHKKQTGGQGQYARILGRVEPLDDPTGECEFVDAVVGGTIPPEYIPSCRKGFQDALLEGGLIGQTVTGVRFIIQDGAWHPVDSSDLAFRFCSKMAFLQGFKAARPTLMEPIMTVEVACPSEYQGIMLQGLTKRRGTILNSVNDGVFAVINAEVPLNNMFGYSTEIRSQTQGKAEFSMEFAKYEFVPLADVDKIVASYVQRREEKRKSK